MHNSSKASQAVLFIVFRGGINGLMRFALSFAHEIFPRLHDVFSPYPPIGFPREVPARRDAPQAPALCAAAPRDGKLDRSRRVRVVMCAGVLGAAFPDDAWGRRPQGSRGGRANSTSFVGADFR